MGKILVAVSGKGGVGRTTFITNIGVSLAERDLKVLLLDMNNGIRNLDVYMGLENKTIFDIADVLEGICSLKKARVRDKRFKSLFLISAAQRKEKFLASPDKISQLYTKLKEEYDYILIDGPCGINKDLEDLTFGVDIAVIITTPDYVALRDGDMIERIMKDNEVKNRFYLLNKIDSDLLSSGALPTFEEINSIMRLPLLGVVPYDKEFIISTNKGIPAVMGEQADIKLNINNIVDRLLGN